jgi:hypothetical protein
VMSKMRAAIVGSSATVKAGVEKLVSETGADEIVVVTDAYEHEDRLRSYERVAKEIAVAAQVRGSQLYVRSLGADRVVDYKTEDV